ncbi:ring-opening amidohydrolase [Acidithiobacillus concretivorus]|uniref:Cyclic amide hydrolase n=1 Tax=Acidithiobacillus concretivorus TaxID=3063952 RepID=A0ABS5ZVX5_9PROT|nr:ring-opening amidohydrolase [Acidithiobacillus concretivorus]MBU2740069.1 ring-opening amidohydrolase [Acidithiobacillus concretivorus]
MRTDLSRFFTSGPADVSGLAEAIARGEIIPTDIVAIIGKTEGNGGINDFTRNLAIMALSHFLAPFLECSPEAVEERIVLSFSGGSEGVTAPHLLVFTISGTVSTQKNPSKRLALATGFTRPFMADEVGRMPMIMETARTVKNLMQKLQVAAEDVHLVQIKGAIPPVSLPHPNLRCDMAWSRGASALGVALALGEVSESQLSDAVINSDWSLFSTRASVSAKPLLSRSEIVLFANSDYWEGELLIAHGVMQDIIDVPGIYSVLEQLDLKPQYGQLTAHDSEKILGVFAKSDAHPGNQIRQRRHTMWTDADISDMRYSRCVVAAQLAGVLGDTGVYVSTRAEHQGPQGGGPLAIIGVAP